MGIGTATGQSGSCELPITLRFPAKAYSPRERREFGARGGAAKAARHWLNVEPQVQTARALRRKGRKLREIADVLGISVATASRWTKGPSPIQSGDAVLSDGFREGSFFHPVKFPSFPKFGKELKREEKGKKNSYWMKKKPTSQPIRSVSPVLIFLQRKLTQFTKEGRPQSEISSVCREIRKARAA